MNEKFLIIGLDGLDWKLFNKFSSEGLFNKCSKEIEQGFKSRLDTTIPSITPVALPSFMTGLTPLKIKDGYVSGQKRVKDFSQIPHETFWEYNDIKSCIVNLRCTYKPRELNGKLVAGDLYTPSEKSDYTYPKELKSKVKGFHDKLDNREYRKSVEKCTSILKKDTQEKLKVFRNLILNEDFDISLFWDGNMDLLFHYRWGKWNEIREYIEMIDDKIHSIYRKTKAKNIILLSDHGFDRKHQYDFHLNTWLKKKSYLKMKGLFKLDYLNSLIYKLGIKHKKLGRILNKITSTNKKKEENDFAFSRRYPGVDYNKTLAQAPKGFWGIELNWKKLEKDEYEKIRSKIIGELEKVKHKGKRVFKDIWTSEELYGVSTYEKNVPDLFFVNHPNYRCVPPAGKKLVSKTAEGNPKTKGGHENSPCATFIAQGDDIKSKNFKNKFNIYDIAPTLLHYFGVSIPKNMDGKVRKGIFKKNSKAYQRKITYSEEKEKERIKNLVKDLKF